MKKKNQLLAGIALTAFAIAPAYAQDQVADSGADDSDEGIVVTGIRGSLERGIAQKRNADVIVDAISAEELGKFPDNNVAESLQRITGVAISRDRGGEGRFVTVRGLGEEFNLLTFNGRRLATENAGREFSFDVLPSELISAAQVFKSSDSSQLEGSIGGLVNIETPKPLDRPGLNFSASLAGQYEGLADDVGLKGSALISQTFADDRFGILASFSYEQRDLRADTAETIAIDDGTDFNGDGVGDRLNAFTANITEEDRERIGATLVLQYQPSDDWTITLDGLYTSFSSPGISDVYSYFPNAPAIVPGSAVVDADNDVISQISSFEVSGDPFSNILDLVARRTESDTETYQFGGNIKGNFSDSFKVNLDVSYSRSDGARDNIGSDTGSGSFFVVGFPGAIFTQTANGTGVPDVQFTTQQADSIPGQVSLADLNPDGARFHFSRNTSNEVLDEIFTARADFELEFNDSVTFKFGGNYTDRTKENRLFDNVATQCGDTGIDVPRVGSNSFFCDRSLEFADFLTPDQLQGLFRSRTGGDLLNNISADIPRDFPQLDINIIETAFENLGAEIGEPSFLTATFNPTNSSLIEEQIWSGYVGVDLERDWGSVPIKANGGVRFVYTDLTSSSVGSTLTNIVIDNVSGNNNITVAEGADLSIENDYFEILPSLNVSAEFTPNLFARFGYSRSLSRPTFNDLSAAFAVTQINAGQESAAGGNPNLEPILADNVDLSLEYYGDNGFTASIAGFYKSLENFVANVNSVLPITIPNAVDLANNPLPPQTVNFDFSGPQNVGDAELYGVEIAAQYISNIGFGVSGNITLTESNLDTAAGTTRLEGTSDVSWNASVFYEGNGIQARASVNQRGDFLDATDGEGGFAEIVDTFTQVDISLSYDVTDNFTVFAEGINILNEQSFTFSERPSFLETFIDNGARWLFGVRANF